MEDPVGSSPCSSCARILFERNLHVLEEFTCNLSKSRGRWVRLLWYVVYASTGALEDLWNHDMTHLDSMIPYWLLLWCDFWLFKCAMCLQCGKTCNLVQGFQSQIVDHLISCFKKVFGGPRAIGPARGLFKSLLAWGCCWKKKLVEARCPMSENAGNLAIHCV